MLVANVAIQKQKVKIFPSIPGLFCFYFLYLTAYVSILKEKRQKFLPFSIVSLFVLIPAVNNPQHHFPVRICRAADNSAAQQIRVARIITHP